MTNEVMYKLLKAIEKEAKTNQRQLAVELDVSLGRVNFFINELLEKGLITTEGTTTNKRRACLYYLTPAGFTERAAVTMRYMNELKEARKRIDEDITALEEESKKICMALQRGISKMYESDARIKGKHK